MPKTIRDALTNEVPFFYCADCDKFIPDTEKKNFMIVNVKEARQHLSENPNHKIYYMFTDKDWLKRIANNETWILAGAVNYRKEDHV